MRPDDVYEQWKEQRSEIEPPPELNASVISAIDGVESPFQPPVTSTAATSRGLFGHPAWAAVAVVAASIVGIMRVTCALLIGIL